MKKEKTLTMVQMALLAALVIVLQLFFSSVRVGPVTLSFVLIPIVIAGIFIGPVAGMLIGLLAGLTTLIQVFTSADPFYLFLVTANPAVTAVLCLVKTAAAGYFSGLLYRALRKHKTPATFAASALCPVVNTGLFCLGMFLFFAEPLLNDPTFGELASANGVIYFILIGLAGVNFVIELILNLILCPVIADALRRTKYFKNV